MQQIIASIHEYATLVTSLLLAVSALLGTLLTVSEKLALNDNVKYSGICHFFKLAVPMLKVAKADTDKAADDIKQGDKSLKQSTDGLSVSTLGGTNA